MRLSQAKTFQLHQSLNALISTPPGFIRLAFSAIEQLNRLLDSQFSVVTHSNTVLSPGFLLVYPLEFPLIAYKPVFEIYLHQHPHHRLWTDTDNEVTGPLQFSDILPRQKLEGLDLYQSFFKPLQTRNLLAQHYRTTYLDSRSIRLPEDGSYKFSRPLTKEKVCGFNFACGSEGKEFSAEEIFLFDFFCRQAVLLLQRELLGELAACQARSPENSAMEVGIDAPPQFLGYISQACKLTRAQSRVLRWLAVGKTNGEIAIILGNSERTIEAHVAAIFEKLKVENRVAAAYTVWSGRNPG